MPDIYKEAYENGNGVSSLFTVDFRFDLESVVIRDRIFFSLILYYLTPVLTGTSVLFDL